VSRITIVTPTFQRADTLPRLYESLAAQSFGDFGWLVVDDGSSDGTERLVRSWAEAAPFSIEYIWQENQGKHAAVNRGVERAGGEFCALMDSDDWYAPDALRRMVECWEDIPAGRRGEFANVEGLCADPDGTTIGDRFPEAVLDSNAFEIAIVHGVKGDKIGMYRREVLLAHPFPEDLGWHVTPALVWNRIAARWSGRYVNEVWAYKEYLSAGLSGRETELRLRFPEPEVLYWKEFAGMPRPMPLLARIRAHANYVRHGLLAGMSVRRIVVESPAPALTLAVAPLGAALWARDRRRAREIAPGDG
jgi:glycosyltransferase involved in cell wall biosynthesis